VGFDTGETLADRMRAHAGDHDHLYGHLMRAMADDWEASGPVRNICRGWEDAPEGAVVQLRLLAGLFRIVLTGRAPELVRFYDCLGGTEPPDKAWPAVAPVLAANIEELHAALEIAPQTNEAGRSNALLVGLFDAVRRTGLQRVRLLEPGASAGLNLLVDRFRYINAGWHYGPVASPLVLAGGVRGRVEVSPFEIIERRGCDLAPIDAATEEGRLRLRSFVWPWQVERHHRLAAALRVAALHPVTVDTAAAGDWLANQLTTGPPDGVLTVVWQSITRMYWPDEEASRVLSTIAKARHELPLAHISMEYPVGDTAHGAELVVDVSAPATLEQSPGPVRLASVGDHGVPVSMRR
jgi:hypothetical protein